MTAAGHYETTRALTLEPRSRLVSADSEELVLAALLADYPHAAAGAEVQQLQGRDFAGGARALLFAVMRDLAARGAPVDVVSVANELQARGELDAAGGYDYLRDLEGEIVVRDKVDYHAKHVRELAERRQINEAIAERTAELETARAPAHEILAAWSELFARLADQARPVGGHGFLTAADVEQIPPPRFLVEGLIQAEAVAVLVGKYASGKSFLALNMALDVATGLPFLGRPVISGPVLYVATEGARGLGVRLAAWRASRNTSRNPADFYCEPASVQLLDPPEVSRLVSRIRQMPAAPVLVVLDTFARCTVGYEENSVKDMGRAMEAAALIQRQTGATVLLVHHAGNNGNLRGSTSIPGAVESIIAVEKDESGKLKLTIDKQKDGEDGFSFDARLERVAASCAIGPWLPMDQGARIPSESHKNLVRALDMFRTDGGATVSRWLETTKVPKSSFYLWRNDLLAWGYVAQDRKGKGALYRVTPAGEMLIGPASNIGPTLVQQTEATLVCPTAHPFRGAGRTGASLP